MTQPLRGFGRLCRLCRLCCTSLVLFFRMCPDLGSDRGSGPCLLVPRGCDPHFDWPSTAVTLNHLGPPRSLKSRERESYSVGCAVTAEQIADLRAIQAVFGRA